MVKRDNYCTLIKLISNGEPVMKKTNNSLEYYYSTIRSVQKKGSERNEGAVRKGFSEEVTLEPNPK